MLILVCGNIAVGKSTVARLIHNKIGGIILQTNEIRNKWYPNPSYSEEEIDHVYDLFFNEVKNSLKKPGRFLRLQAACISTSRQVKYPEKVLHLAFDPLFSGSIQRSTDSPHHVQNESSPVHAA